MRCVDFERFLEKSVLKRKMVQNERFFVFLSTWKGKMEANKIAESFPTYPILAFVGGPTLAQKRRICHDR